MNHLLHKAIGDMFAGDLLPGYEFFKDPACGGEQNLPLFCSKARSKQNEYTNVDLLILLPD